MKLSPSASLGSKGPCKLVYFLTVPVYLWDPHGTNFTIFHSCHHCFQYIKACIQFCIQFLVVICQFMQMSWFRHSSFHGVTAVHECPEHRLSFTSLSPCWNTPHPCQRAHNIHCLVSTSFQQVLMKVNKCFFFFLSTQRNSARLWLHTHFCVRFYFVTLLLSCHLSFGMKV